MAHIDNNASVQNPTALCRSQLIRFHRPLIFTVSARFHHFIPGHQITNPDMQSNKRKLAPMPLKISPILPDNRLM